MSAILFLAIVAWVVLIGGLLIALMRGGARR
jgi:hypothetical protein